MAEKSLFYNALPDPQSVTGYDRNYNADDISEFYQFSFSTGVVKSNSENNEPTGLKVVASSGMNINVNAGYACINGKPYINTAAKTFTITPNGTSANRYDYIVLRYDNNMSVRNTYLTLVTGNGTIPNVERLTRVGKQYELMLGYITVAPSTTNITQTNIKDTRGNVDLCPWFTAVKGSADYYDAIIQTYEFNKTLDSATVKVITDLPSNLYNAKYSLLDVYTNGLKEPKTAYTVSLSGGYIVITFTASKSAGTKITVNLDNFLDGEGMSTVLAQYTDLVQDVAKLNAAGEYNYICNGINDNVLISDIAQAFANDATLPANAQLTINVYGNLGMTAAYAGDGSNSNRYQWLNIGTPVGSDKRIIVDFTHCNIINVPLKGNTRNAIFNGYNVQVKNARLIANCNETGCVVFIFASNNGEIKAENCYFESLVTSDVYLSYSGTFINCEAYLSSTATHAYCFYLVSASKPVTVIGGRYRAYTGNSASGYVSALAYSPSAETTATISLYSVNCPTVARSGFYQKYAVLFYAGYISSLGLVTALPITLGSGVSNAMTGTVPLSK